jgi:predicted dehydrogenase
MREPPASETHAEWSEGFEIYGSKGHVSVRIPFPFSRQASVVKVFKESDLAHKVPVFADTDPYKRQLEAFARAVLERQAVTPDTEDGIAALAIVEAVRDAVSTDPHAKCRGQLVSSAE